ncbi:MAG TPA: D-aminoacyl-tRNA deacylase [Candidatus Nanoarchaeia archaeon]|nr:D-aminoacyl-tRNA deacylase [Candidatus Nanoarchaeia archaeon]
MFKRYLVVASKKDKAGVNITTNLSQFRENPVLASLGEKPAFDFYLVEDEMIYTENINKEKINSYDFIIFASRHKSESNQKTLSIHTPGNFREAKYGGTPGKVCPASAVFQKFMYEKLHDVAKEYELNDYDITLEATHHGPLINRPCLFIEIGSTEQEWNDRRAGFVIAKTISDTIKEFEFNSYREVAVAIGGPHYCPNFNKIQEHSNIAISHIIAQYSLPLTEEMIKEAIEKTEEEVDFVLLDVKGLGNAEQRDQVLGVLDKLYINIRKTNNIEKDAEKE